MAFIRVLWLVGARLATILSVTIRMGPAFFFRLIYLVLYFVSLCILIISLNLRYFE